MRIDKSALRKMKIEKKGDDSNGVRRICIECIDFDWIFQGDNAQNFIVLLSNEARSKLFLTKSIRIFVKFMW